jgi:hypothetical protein
MEVVAMERNRVAFNTPRRWVQDERYKLYADGRFYDYHRDPAGADPLATGELTVEAAQAYATLQAALGVMRREIQATSRGASDTSVDGRSRAIRCLRRAPHGMLIGSNAGYIFNNRSNLSKMESAPEATDEMVSTLQLRVHKMTAGYRIYGALLIC